LFEFRGDALSGTAHQLIAHADDERGRLTHQLCCKSLSHIRPLARQQPKQHYWGGAGSPVSASERIHGPQQTEALAMARGAKQLEEPPGATAALLRQRCEVDADAAYGLSVLTARGGDGVARDRTEALRLLIRSAELGKTEAQCQYAQLLVEGAGGVDRDEAEACEWLRIAARNDCAEAQYRLGLFTLRGRGTPQNARQARSYMAEASKSGHGPAARWLREQSPPKKRDGPSPRQGPPPPSLPPAPRPGAWKACASPPPSRTGPPSPERVANDGEALRGALSEARAVAAAARVARGAAEDETKRMRKERDAARQKMETATEALKRVGRPKKPGRDDAQLRRLTAKHATELSKLGAAHAASKQALLEKDTKMQCAARAHADIASHLEAEKRAAIKAFDRVASQADRREKEIARLGSLTYAQGLESELRELRRQRDADLGALQAAWDSNKADLNNQADEMQASLVAEIAQRDLELEACNTLVASLKASVERLDASKAADAARAASEQDRIVRRARSDVARTEKDSREAKEKALRAKDAAHAKQVQRLDAAHDRARSADATRHATLAREADRRGADFAATAAKLRATSGAIALRDQSASDARDGRRAAEALLRTEVGVAIDEAQRTGARMDALLARRRDRERRRSRADADAHERLVSDYRALADEQAVAVADLERDHRDSGQKLRDALAAETRRREAAEALVADHGADLELRDAREAELARARDEVDRLEGDLADARRPVEASDELRRTRELLRTAGANMNALEERRRAEVAELQAEVARLGALTAGELEERHSPLAAFMAKLPNPVRVPPENDELLEEHAI